MCFGSDQWRFETEEFFNNVSFCVRFEFALSYGDDAVAVFGDKRI